MQRGGTNRTTQGVSGGDNSSLADRDGLGGSALDEDDLGGTASRGEPIGNFSIGRLPCWDMTTIYILNILSFEVSVEKLFKCESISDQHD